MREQEGYLRWLGRFLSKAPGGLKNVVIGISKFLGDPHAEAFVGKYTIIIGVVAIVGNIYWNWPNKYTELFGKSYSLGLKNPQWSLITLVGFFFLTHGLYRIDKEA